jgi:ureidoacrylate peracid hydrolase
MDSSRTGPQDMPRHSNVMLLTVDVQNDYCHEQGALAKGGADVRELQRAARYIETLLECARSVGIPRTHVRTEHDACYDDAAWLKRGTSGHTLDVQQFPIARQGSWGSEFYRIRPRPDELVIVKHRFSAFAYTDLELVLRTSRIDTVVLCGVTTNVCVNITGIDALMRGFYPVIVREAVAAPTAAEHVSALETFTQYFGKVIDLAAIQKAWNPEQPDG